MDIWFFSFSQKSNTSWLTLNVNKEAYDDLKLTHTATVA